MRFLIVGTGSIGRRHYKNLLALGYHDIVVVRSKRAMDAPQREFFTEYKPRVFFDLRKALAEKPDAVFVCNPTSLHVPTARAAVRAGAHVFVEKPISHVMAGVDALIQEARKRKKVLYIGYHYRHHPLLKIVKRMLDAGKLGQVHAARFFNGEYLPDWHPWEDHRKAYAGRRDLGGGVVLTQSHDLDLIQWFFGRPEVQAAVVENSRTLGVDVDDNAVITFRTALCPLVTSHLDYLSRPSVKQCSVIGLKGSLEWDYHGNTLQVTDAKGKARVIASPPGFERNQMYIAEVKDFLRCIRRGGRPASDGVSGKAVLAMALAAKEASRKVRI